MHSDRTTQYRTCFASDVYLAYQTFFIVNSKHFDDNVPLSANIPPTTITVGLTLQTRSPQCRNTDIWSRFKSYKDSTTFVALTGTLTTDAGCTDSIEAPIWVVKATHKHSWGTKPYAHTDDQFYVGRRYVLFVQSFILYCLRGTCLILLPRVIISEHDNNIIDEFRPQQRGQEHRG